MAKLHPQEARLQITSKKKVPPRMSHKPEMHYYFGNYWLMAKNRASWTVHKKSLPKSSIFQGQRMPQTSKHHLQGQDYRRFRDSISRTIIKWQARAHNLLRRSLQPRTDSLPNQFPNPILEQAKLSPIVIETPPSLPVAGTPCWPERRDTVAPPIYL